MRNPIERAWSALRYRLWHGRGLKATELSVEELLKIIQHPEILLKGKYKDILNRWENQFSKHQIFYLFYDDIIKHPRELLENICVFLKVDPKLLPDPEGDHRRVYRRRRKKTVARHTKSVARRRIKMDKQRQGAIVSRVGLRHQPPRHILLHHEGERRRCQRQQPRDNGRRDVVG